MTFRHQLVILHPVCNLKVSRRRYYSEAVAREELRVAKALGWAGYVVSRGRIIDVAPGRRDV